MGYFWGSIWRWLWPYACLRYGCRGCGDGSRNWSRCFDWLQSWHLSYPHAEQLITGSSPAATIWWLRQSSQLPFLCRPSGTAAISCPFGQSTFLTPNSKPFMTIFWPSVLTSGISAPFKMRYGGYLTSSYPMMEGLVFLASFMTLIVGSDFSTTLKPFRRGCPAHFGSLNEVSMSMYLSILSSSPSAEGLVKWSSSPFLPLSKD